MNQKTNTPNQTPDNAKNKAQSSADKTTHQKSNKAADNKQPTQGQNNALTQVESKTSTQVETKASTQAESKSAKSTENKSSGGKGFQYFLLLLILILAGVIWFINDQNTQQIAAIESQMQQQSSQNNLAIDQSKQAVDALKKQNEQIDQLNKAIVQSQNDFNTLNKSFQLVADRGSELILLNDIEHLVTIAQQQLQLSGNVSNAIISLETAQTQLSRVSKPEFASLQQTINGDLQRLRTAATVDVSLLSSSLEELAGLILQAPLMVPDDAVPQLESKLNQDTTQNNDNAVTQQDTQSTNGDGEWWQEWPAKAWNWSVDTASTIKYDLNKFVSVRRVDDASALLISSDQAARFRDNLRLRIMTAQLALMMGQSQVWHTETSAVLDAVQNRFDKDSSVTRKAIKIARQVADAEIDVEIPSVNNTVNAIKTIRESNADNPNGSKQ